MPSRSTGSVTAAIPDTVVNDGPARRPALAAATDGSRVLCPPDRCPSNLDDCVVANTIIAGQQGTYRHPRAVSRRYSRIRV
jgi:hypothetical protein